jgi:hypothetical protein
MVYTVIGVGIFLIYKVVRSILHYLLSFRTRLNPVPGNKSFPETLAYKNS